MNENPDQVIAAMDLLPQATDATELEVVMVWLTEETKQGSITQNREITLSLLTALVENFRNTYYFEGQSETLLVKLITSRKFLTFLEAIYLENSSDSETVIEAMHCIGYFMVFKKKQAEKIFQIISQHPDLALTYLHQQNTGAAMLQLLLSCMKNFPEFWTHQIPLKKVLTDFLFSGETTVEELIGALKPIQLIDDNNRMFSKDILELVGFSVDQSRKIADTWEKVFHMVNTIKESMLPNLLNVIFLEAELPGAAKTLHEIYGIQNFARNTVEQFVAQTILYRQITEESRLSPPIVLSLGVDDDWTGALLGKRNEDLPEDEYGETTNLWNAVSKALEEKGLQLIVAETGRTIENVVSTLQKIQEIHKEAKQIILSFHASKTGLILYFQPSDTEVDEETGEIRSLGNRHFVEIPHEEIQNQMTPKLRELLAKDGSMILDICHAVDFIEDFCGIELLYPKGDMNALVNMKSGESVPLEPSYVEYYHKE